MNQNAANGAAQIQQAIALHQSGELEQAEAVYKKLLFKTPRHFQGLYLYGMLKSQMKDFAAAADLMTRAIKINPLHPDTHYDLATALEELGQYPEALSRYNAFLKFKPDFTEALFRRGNILRHLGRPVDALESYAKVLADHTNIAEVWFQQGNALSDLGRTAEAVVAYQRAVELHPEFIEALFNLGNAYLELDRPQDALDSYEHALAVHPEFPEALANQGFALFRLKRAEEALAAYDRALALRSDYLEPMLNRGATLEELGRHQEALQTYARAQEIDAESATAHWNEALVLLLLGDFQAGWRKYEWRWRTAQLQAYLREFAVPLWLGEPASLEGKTILLHAEQGFGDTLQFARYIPMVASRGATVILEVQPALKSLLSGLEGVSQIFAAGEALPLFDYHCPLMSLPLAFDMRSEEDIPVIAALPADAERTAAWQEKLGTKERLRVGLVWSGTPLVTTPTSAHLDAVRSIHFATLAPLLNNANIEFHSLQVGEKAVKQLRVHPQAKKIIEHSADLNDFADTAALIEQLDLVITVDTAVAHLAGTIGKSVWLLNRRNTDWRWQLEGSDSPWYPSMRIFRQKTTGSWSDVVAQVTRELAQLAPR